MEPIHFTAEQLEAARQALEIFVKATNIKLPEIKTTLREALKLYTSILNHRY